MTEKTTKETNDLEIIEGELSEAPLAHEVAFLEKEIAHISPQNAIEKSEPRNEKARIKNRNLILLHFGLPFLFLTVALLGGLRLSAADSAFLFIRPPLVALIFGSILLVLFFRARLIQLEGWFSEDFSITKNIANGTCLITLFFASVQIFNSLLPEQGLPFWILAFCFFWTLWNNLFADFDTKKLLRSLGAMFGLAFVVKYLILLNLTAPSDESWWHDVFKNMTKEAFVWIFDLPRFSAGTGYIQFFALAFYLIGLFLSPSSTRSSKI